MKTIRAKINSSKQFKFGVLIWIGLFSFTCSTSPNLYQTTSQKLSPPSPFAKCYPKLANADLIIQNAAASKPPINSITAGVTLVLACTFAANLGFREVFIQIVLGNFSIALLNFLFLPLAILMCLYPIGFFVFSVTNFFKPGKIFLTDRKYYSVIPKRKPEKELWPTATIQIPIYTENFDSVIKPTLLKAIEAAKHYRNAGGYANIIVNDDALMKLANDNLKQAEEEIQKRLQFYKTHGIAFTARSKENRPGRFKKAGNMNSGMRMGLFLESKLGPLLLHTDQDRIQTTLNEQIQTMSVPFYAEGDIRLGDFIVLLDKDSVIPEEAITKTIPEFLLEPHLGFTQHKTVPTNENENYFSYMIGRFTLNLFQLVFINTTHGGDPSPFVGHNAILRKEAMIKASFEQDNTIHIWHENKVSEDFDLAMRMQTKGYFGRYVAYPNMNFGEGVTRTYQEEIKKLSKFAFGASEMLFNPIYLWPQKGICTETLLTYLKSKDIAWYSKFNMLVYLLSYLALSMVTIKMAFNIILILLGNYSPMAATTTYTILISAIALFAILGPTSLFVLRLKLYLSPTFNNEFEGPLQEIKRDFFFAFMFFLFYTAVPFYITKGFFSHLFNLKMEWGATNMNELKKESWTKTAKEILTAQKDQFQFCSILTLLLVYACFTTLNNHLMLAMVIFVFPLSHMLVPFLFNPKFVEELKQAIVNPFLKSETITPLEHSLPRLKERLSILISDSQPIAVSL